MYDSSGFFTGLLLLGAMLFVIVLTGGCTKSDLATLLSDKKVVKYYCLDSETYQIVKLTDLWDKTKSQVETKYPKLKDMPFTLDIADETKQKECSNKELEDLFHELKTLKDSKE